MAEERGKNFGGVGVATFGGGVEGEKKSGVREDGPRLQWRSQPMGAKINLHDKDAVFRAMGEG